MKTFVQFFKFSIVGISNAVVYFVVYYGLIWLGWSYLFANLCAWVISIANAYVWNRRYVFQNRKAVWKTMGKMYLSYGASFCVGSILLFGIVEIGKISEYFAAIIVAVVSIPINFLLNKFWAFR